MSATINVTGSNPGNMLNNMLMADEIMPGDDPSYQLCKTIYLYHPLGKKMADGPINIAQSQKRVITIPGAPEEVIRKAFEEEWKRLKADEHIFSVMSQSRVYGIASLVYGAKGVPTNKAIDPLNLPGLEIYFNIADPLNTAGSLVLNQDPNAPDFQKHGAIAISGQQYHRSRSCVIMNEEPIYISYTSSAFGFVGRSVYQRALFPLKTFIQSMITDDMVTRKGGLLIAAMKQAGSIVDAVMAKASSIKRKMLQSGETGNVLTVGHEDKVESLDLKNTETALITARKNVLENCAAAADMPAAMLNNETFAEGFGEGTEDAKRVAGYVSGIREEMQPLYDFFDNIVMYRAWNPEFYATVQYQFPEYKNVPYIAALMKWKNAFQAVWPSLLTEPESELAKVEKVALEAITSVVETMGPSLDPENKATLLIWAADNLSEKKKLFPNPLILDRDALEAWVPPPPPNEAELA